MEDSSLGMNTEKSTCTGCEAPLPAAVRGELCPACLMGGMLESMETLPGDSAADSLESSPSQQFGADSLEGTTLGIGGRYKILQRIGEGGFGTVFMAEQTVPVRRRVAIKILKAGMDTHQVVARFEAERQALAMMDHPNIAKVLDGGETEQGRPYFVMELVRGTPITTFCDREGLDPKARLRLFILVCQAVQHAHQKGIIHRDLKPGNILIAMPDGAEPVPKVIDFGVAKAMESNLTDKTLFTRFEQMIGTPAYMSPEQAGSEGTHDIDTRADIYALGVLLYELLTGTTPFDAKTLQSAAFDEVRRILREEEAPRPSARIGSMEIERRTSIARERGAELVSLGKQLRGDLDWIVMKAIEKDRRRRYETANGLALDVERHLADEPIEARAPSVAYRFHKFARRNKTLLATAATIAVILVAASVVSIVAAMRARAAERQVTMHLQEVEHERNDKETARREVEIQRNEALWNEYVASQYPIVEAWRNREFGRLSELIDTQIPEPGQPDFRGWEWCYYRDQCDRAFSTIPGRHPAWRPGSRDVSVFIPKSDTETAIELRSAADGTFVRTLANIKARPDDIGETCWSVDGNRFAYCTKGGEVAVIDAATGKPVFHRSAIEQYRSTEPKEREWRSVASRIALTRDGNTLATGNWIGLILLWDIDGEAPARVLHQPSGSEHVESMRFSPRGNHLAAALRFGRRTSWDIATGEAFEYDRVCDKNGTVAWNRSGTHFAATNDGSLSIYELSRAAPVATFPHQGVHQLAWISDSQLASSGGDQVLRVWDTADSEEPAEHRLTRAALWHLGANTAGDLMVMEVEKETRIAPIGTPIPPVAVLAPENPSGDCIHFIEWSRSGGVLLSGQCEHGSEGGAYKTPIRTWDAETAELMTESTLTPSIKSLTWSPDGSEAWISSGSCKLWRVSTISDALPSSDPLPTGPVGIAVSGFSPDARWLLYGRADKVLLVDTANGSSRTELSTHGVTSAVKWRPDGKTVAVASWDQLMIWDPFANQVIARGVGKGKIEGIAWDPGHRFLAAGSEHGWVQIFDAGTLEEIAGLNGHRGAVVDVDWAGHGRIASAGSDGTVRLWDTATGHELLALPHPQGIGFRSVRWSPDGRRLAAGDAEGRVFIWGSCDIEFTTDTQGLATGVIANRAAH